MVDRLGPVMEPELNCSSQCESPLCFIQSGVSRQEGLDVLQRLCTLNLLAVELPRRSLSPVLSAVVWTLLSCGILSAFCFLFFTLRFKNNRIVKMSSPNLNILTLFGSVLTYTSGVLFAVDDRAHSQTGTSTAMLQAQMWTLCVGSTLVFGPILGKTWRLYRVFTQRVPDKRVIIRDIQLIGMVALLILVDILVLTAWNLTDPVRCSRSVGAVVKVMERDISYSLSQLDSCSSLYSHMWVIVIAVQKGCLLLYGTYLAGLTSNVSHPPVNQSPTILTAVTLVTFSSAVVVPASIFLQSWPNLVYSIVAGAIFICTLATNCVLFVPQLTQWRQFEEDQNNPSQMAKYFSSPSKSQPSVYSQDEIYYLLGENSSMKKMLSEKNAAIDSLQEQVNNAKDKLLRLMTASQPLEEQDVDSSATNLNSSSTQNTELQSEAPSSSSLSQGDPKSRLSPPILSPHLPPAPASSNAIAPSSKPSSKPSSIPNSSASVSVPSSLHEDVYTNEIQRDVPNTGPAHRYAADSRAAGDVKQPVPFKFPGRTAEETVHFVNSLQAHRGVKPPQGETFVRHGGLTLQMGPNTRPTGFVSSEQLQEILQELSVDAVTETTLRSPSQTSRAPSLLKLSTLSPLSLRSPCSPHPPVLFRYPSISPYVMRKRRPPFHSSRRALPPPCFYTGSDVSRCRKKRGNCERQNPNSISVDEMISHDHNNDPGLENEEEEREDGADGQEVMGKCQRCVSRSHRCAAPRDVEEGGESEQHHQHIRDSSGYWDSDSSSSTDYCYYHRPYCNSCLQRGSLLCSDSSSDSSDSEYDGYTSLYRSSRPVVFKDDIKPTFV
ncbi:putative G-protein coupled receptor 156 isoform 1-T1 [Odontesthes bonariensis]|uniref:putative G-protein coupled receptor 156 n=1 Tax=Odontesthes bonariensis TaxID=219752 RepID=UPI003F58A80A